MIVCSIYYVFAQVILSLPVLCPSSVFKRRKQDRYPRRISDNGMEDRYRLTNGEVNGFMASIVEMHIYSIVNAVELLQILINSSAVSCLQV
jgi:hypothetical protein